MFKIKEFFILCFLFLGITFSGYSLDIQASIEKEFQRAQPEPGYDSAARGVITFELYNDNPDDLYNYFIFQTYDDDISCDGWLTRAQVINKTNPYFDWQDPKCYFRWYRPYYGWEPVSAVQISLDCTVNWRSWESKGPILRCKLGIMKNGEVVYIGVPKPGFEVAKHFNIQIDKHMDLGKTFAGGTLSTRPGGSGNPAEVTIESEKENKFKILIPEVVTIINQNDSSQKLNVNLALRNKTSDNVYCPQEERNGYGYTHFLIDGVCRTNSEQYGKYQGSFVVRVEYTDEV
ncbi:DUF4402 domain-containing protein [Fusobacterium sp.]|uniref:DUF4402 domain-containing protein n=1 Tax=Fusobacterium sp. TaxID=68766 RepID=UPI00396C8DAE